MRWFPVRVQAHFYSFSSAKPGSSLADDDLYDTQVARLWLSCQGAISPLHYDAATSLSHPGGPLTRCLHQP